MTLSSQERASSGLETRGRNVKRVSVATAGLLALVCGGAVWQVVRSPDLLRLPPLVVDDVSRLNPIRVKQRLDPANKFRNRLVDKYFRLAATVVQR